MTKSETITDIVVVCFFFFFSSRRRHTRCSRDWSSDVCSSDLMTMPTSGGRLAIFSSPQGVPSQTAKGFAVLVGSLCDHFRREPWRRRCLVPIQGFQVVAHVLLVE